MYLLCFANQMDLSNLNKKNVLTCLVHLTRGWVPLLEVVQVRVMASPSSRLSTAGEGEALSSLDLWSAE